MFASSYSGTQKPGNSRTRELGNSGTRELGNLGTRELGNSGTRKPRNSRTQELRSSKTKVPRNSGTRKLRNLGTRDGPLRAPYIPVVVTGRFANVSLVRHTPTSSPPYEVDSPKFVYISSLTPTILSTFWIMFEM